MGADTRGPTSQSENSYGLDVSESEHSLTFGSFSFCINRVGIITPNLWRVFFKRLTLYIILWTCHIKMCFPPCSFSSLFLLVYFCRLDLKLLPRSYLCSAPQDSLNVKQGSDFRELA